jgi:hypothetical protein
MPEVRVLAPPISLPGEIQGPLRGPFFIGNKNTPLSCGVFRFAFNDSRLLLELQLQQLALRLQELLRQVLQPEFLP